MKRFFLFALVATVFAACSTATLEMPIPSNEIWYTSSNGNVIKPYSGYFNSNATAMQLFGANITSNIYKNGVGVITFDGDVTTIGDYAFYNCKALTSVTIPDSVTTIGVRAFEHCSALTSVTIPDSVTTIGGAAFGSCGALTSVTIPDSVTKIGSYAFDSCSALISVTIPDSVTTIGDYAFAFCDALTSVTIPDSVTKIGQQALDDCTSLKEVYCKPITPPSLGNSSVFDSNASGRKIYVPTASVDAYKAATYWSEYASAIYPYTFTE